MQAYPHLYSATAQGMTSGAVAVTSAELPPIESAPPPEFDGPRGVWSPETLLVASIADCFVLTFRGVARASGMTWHKVACTVEGTLDRVGGVTQFTRYTTRATLTVAPGADTAKARDLLERAEKVCLVANSLRGERLLETSVVEGPPA